MKQRLIDVSFDDIAEQAVLNGKKIIYLHSEGKKIPDKIIDLTNAYTDRVEIRNFQSIADIFGKDNQQYHMIEVPTILIGGLLEEADTLEVLLQLLIKLRLEGMHITVLAMHPMGELFGFYNLDSVWNSAGYGEAYKIEQINHFVNKIVDIISGMHFINCGVHIYVHRNLKEEKTIIKIYIKCFKNIVYEK